MKRIFLIPMILLLTACQSMSGKVSLAWQVPDDEPLEYQAVWAQFPVDPDLTFNGFELLETAEMRETMADRASAVELPNTTYRAQLLQQADGSIQAAIVDLMPEVQHPEEHDREWLEQRMRERKGGSLALVGYFSPQGQLLSYALRGNARTVLNLLFSMPSSPVAVGDSWNMEITTIEVGDVGVVPEETTRKAKGFLRSLYEDEQGNQVAKVDIASGEKLDGYYPDEHDWRKDTGRLRIEGSFIGTGEFLVEKGRWRSLTLVSYNDISGGRMNEASTIYALRELEGTEE